MSRDLTIVKFLNQSPSPDILVYYTKEFAWGQSLEYKASSFFIEHLLLHFEDFLLLNGAAAGFVPSTPLDVKAWFYEAKFILDNLSLL